MVKSNAGAVWLSEAKCVLISVGNLSTRALSDTKCKLFGIDVVRLMGEAGIDTPQIKFRGPQGVVLDDSSGLD